MSMPPLRLPGTAGHELEDAKHAMRTAVREHRAMRPARELAEAATAFAETAADAVAGAGVVSLYVSTEREPGTSVLLDALHDAGVRVLLPVLGPGLERCWGEYAGPEDLQVRAPGRPPEPSGEVLPAEALGDVDAVLAPALLVDAAGNRLGQGGGWYDRALRHRRPGVPVFALVFEPELLEAGAVPVGDHDTPVDGVVTPRRWSLFERAARLGRAGSAGSVGRA